MAHSNDLVNAIRENNKERVIEILEEGDYNINDENAGDDVPLVWASENNYTDVVKLLLDNGADPNIKGGMNDQSTSLVSASINGFLDIVKLLIEHGADWNITNNYGSVPLDYAQLNNHILIMQLLEDIHEATNELKTEPPKAVFDKYPQLRNVLIKRFIALGNNTLLSRIMNNHFDIPESILEEFYFDNKFSLLPVYKDYNARFNIKNRLQTGLKKNSYSDINLLIQD